MTKHSGMMPLTFLAAILFGLTLDASKTSAEEWSEFKVRQEIPTLETIDIGDEGKSHGDMLAFKATISNEEGEIGILSGILITVNLPTDQSAFEDRMGNLIFTFGDSDSLVVAGTSVYAPDKTEMNANQPQVRAVIGGTGKYLGARGEVTTTRNDDGTYDHDFRLVD